MAKSLCSKPCYIKIFFKLKKEVFLKNCLLPVELCQSKANRGMLSKNCHTHHFLSLSLLYLNLFLTIITYSDLQRLFFYNIIPYRVILRDCLYFGYDLAISKTHYLKFFLAFLPLLDVKSILYLKTIINVL